MELETISEKIDATNPIAPLRIIYFCLEIVDDEKYDTKRLMNIEDVNKRSQDYHTISILLDAGETKASNKLCTKNHE